MMLGELADSEGSDGAVTDPSSERHLLVINGEQDEVYTNWYRTVHIQDIVTNVGPFVSGQLYELSPAQLSADPPMKRFLAIFEIEGDPAEAIAAMRKARAAGELQSAPPHSSVPGGSAIFEPVISKFTLPEA
jgi:hypothetical protein